MNTSTLVVAAARTWQLSRYYSWDGTLRVQRMVRGQWQDRPFVHTEAVGPGSDFWFLGRVGGSTANPSISWFWNSPAEAPDQPQYDYSFQYRLVDDNSSLIVNGRFTIMLVYPISPIRVSGRFLPLGQTTSLGALNTFFNVGGNGAQAGPASTRTSFTYTSTSSATNVMVDVSGTDWNVTMPDTAIEDVRLTLTLVVASIPYVNARRTAIVSLFVGSTIDEPLEFIPGVTEIPDQYIDSAISTFIPIESYFQNTRGFRIENFSVPSNQTALFANPAEADPNPIPPFRVQTDVQDGISGINVVVTRLFGATQTVQRFQLNFTVASSFGGVVNVSLAFWVKPNYIDLSVGRLTVENINQRDIRVTSNYVGPGGDPDSAIGLTTADSRYLRFINQIFRTNDAARSLTPLTDRDDFDAKFAPFLQVNVTDGDGNAVFQKSTPLSPTDMYPSPYALARTPPATIMTNWKDNVGFNNIVRGGDGTLPASFGVDITGLPEGTIWNVECILRSGGFKSAPERQQITTRPLIQGTTRVTSGVEGTINISYDYQKLDGASYRPINAGEISMNRIDWYGAVHGDDLLPIIDDSGNLFSTIENLPAGDYEVVIELNVDNQIRHIRESVTIEGDALPVSKGASYWIDGVDVTRQVLDFQYNHGRKQKQGAPKFWSGGGMLTIIVDDNDEKQWYRKEFQFYLGSRRRYTGYISDVAIQPTDAYIDYEYSLTNQYYQATFTLLGNVSSLDAVDINFVDLGETQKQMLIELDERTGIGAVAYEDGDDLGARKYSLGANAADFVRDIQRYGGKFYEDEYGRLQLGTRIPNEVIELHSFDNQKRIMVWDVDNWDSQDVVWG